MRTEVPGYLLGIRTAPLPAATTVVLALLTAVARLPFLGQPLSPDEAGFLMVGGQWSPGSSLYGDYWVDRPPLIIGIFGLADHLGGATALRLVGVVAVVIAVCLAAAVGRVGAPDRRWAPTLAAATAAVFLSTPLFGTRQVNGELLAAPLVLGGLVALLVALRRGRRAVVWWVAAGALATAAVAVKQSMADVAVASVAALLWQVRTVGIRRSAYDALGLAGGAVLTTLVLVGWAAARGTDPGALWEAVVSFRFKAAEVISGDDPAATDRRMHSMVDALVASAAPVLVLVPLLPVARARQRGPLPLVAAVVLLWETVGIVGGGSYWWHYLIGTVPGLVLLVVALARHRPGLQVVAAVVVAYAAVVGAQVTDAYPGLTRGQREIDTAAGRFAELTRPGDTAVVAFGTASILRRAGVSSPYRYLWSLPVRVRDPHLAGLTAVLRSSHRPTWVVVQGTSLDSWAIDAGTAQEELDRRYRLVAAQGEWHFFRAVGTHGTLTG
ncbi:hypothetical protein SAMN04487968_101307 [Nocardioides terrae]|uniref:Dolichyl-phosphate-mannose-protein mannosyltransferase n=1 Tax=Nocardioides terrae TaxID=574651 RepID=A0A1I1DQZ6_9ACTN|nr:hypothetical protein [Nocardioides terrae]SFB75110.1 hypothetical protein SAMN04487968_101307 [Nocardioides terrae]